MEFREALVELKKGHPIKRTSWKDLLYIAKEKKIENGKVQIENNVKAYYVGIQSFLYDGSILLSDDWVIEGEEGLHTFDVAAQALYQGKKIGLEEWQDKFVIYDKQSKEIILKRLISMDYSPDFQSLLASDWMKVEFNNLKDLL